MTTNNIVTPDLSVSEIQDVYIRDNFNALKSYFGGQNQLLNFKFAEVVFDAANPALLIAHGLGLIPQDIVVTRITGTGKVSFLYDEFDKTNIVLSADGPCRVRFFYGTYWNFTSNIDNKTSDTMVIASGA